jgi:hypothetical protein
MKVARKDDIHLTAGKLFHGHPGATDNVAVIPGTEHVERVMADQESHPAFWKLGEKFTAICHLVCVYSAVFERKRPRRVDTEDGNFLVNVERRQIVADVPSVIPQG